MADRVSAVPFTPIAASAAASVDPFAEKTMRKFFGGSPLLQQGERDFSPAERRLLIKRALAPGIPVAPPSAKAHDERGSFFRSAEALLPPHKCGGSHRTAKTSPTHPTFPHECGGSHRHEGSPALHPLAVQRSIAASPAPRRLWTLPESGLAVFHGHPDVPRLFHYFLPRLVAQGKPVLCLDGANRFDPLLIARFARSGGSEAALFNQRVRVARAFTCFQLTELLARAPRLLEKFPARALMVTALPDLYFDEDVREGEAEASFQRALEALRALRRLRLVTAVFSDAASFQTPRKKFFAQLVAQANQVSRFVEEDGRLALAVDNTAPTRARLTPSSTTTGAR